MAPNGCTVVLIQSNAPIRCHPCYTLDDSAKAVNFIKVSASNVKIFSSPCS